MGIKSKKINNVLEYYKITRLSNNICSSTVFIKVLEYYKITRLSNLKIRIKARTAVRLFCKTNLSTH